MKQDGRRKAGEKTPGLIYLLCVVWKQALSKSPAYLYLSFFDSFPWIGIIFYVLEFIHSF